MHTSLKRKIPATITLAAACAFHFVSFAESVVASAEDAIPVDVRTGECRALPDCKVAYGPCLGGVTNEDAYVVLFKVTDPSVPAEEKEIVYLQGAQHCAEYSGPNVLDGLLRYLADGLDEAGELLKKYEEEHKVQE